MKIIVNRGFTNILSKIVDMYCTLLDCGPKT